VCAYYNVMMSLTKQFKTKYNSCKNLIDRKVKNMYLSPDKSCDYCHANTVSVKATRCNDALGHHALIGDTYPYKLACWRCQLFCAIKA
jgi:hypothetical protein